MSAEPKECRKRGSTIKEHAEHGYYHNGDPDPADPVHYFGCLRPEERLDYFRELSDKDKDHLREEKRRVCRLRAFLEQQEQLENAEYIRNLHARVSPEKLKKLQEQYRLKNKEYLEKLPSPLSLGRIGRQCTLKNDTRAQIPQAGLTMEKTETLELQLDLEYDNYLLGLNSTLKLEEMKRVKKPKCFLEALQDHLIVWRKQRNYQGGDCTEGPEVAHTQKDIENDVKELKSGPENSPDLMANVMYFKNSHGYTQSHRTKGTLRGAFPNQKIPLKTLLFETVKEENPLMEKCEKGMIRYFHLPANNMLWVEEAIARYYNEERPDFTKPFEKPKPNIDTGQKPKTNNGAKTERNSTAGPKTELKANGESGKQPVSSTGSKTRMLLRPQFWRGLQHGGSSDLPFHCRHMRPRCYRVLTDVRFEENAPDNLLLYMPYLHWETDRGRARAAAAIRKARNDNTSTIQDVIDAKKLVLRSPQNTLPKKTVLGRILLLAAAVAQAMEYDMDERLVSHHLSKSNFDDASEGNHMESGKDAPLHPRRTLDQFYYWTLKDTRLRDRDQVVYRATAPRRHENPRDCAARNFGGKCKQCTLDSRKIARVVMVDQLWLFVLDKSTIITSFPKRWGRNKPDPSAVQKRIRKRLEISRDNEIQTVFDLALLIVDECSRTFFDRTRPSDLEPLVLDSFADATGKIRHRQSLAFNLFWHASKNYGSQDREHIEDAYKDFLDVNPEGKLFLEIQDIIDELHIISRVKDQQEKVAKTLIKHIEQIEPGFARPKDAVTDLNEVGSVYWTIQRADHLLDSMQTQKSEIQHMQQAADHTSNALKDLLDLKQQQASIVEARQAVKQAQETLKQGRSIMLFTVVTIIFLPLSFLSSVFGMNTTELTGDGGSVWEFNDVFRYMFPISFALIAVSLLLAFSKIVRTIFSDVHVLLTFGIISYVFNVGWTWLVTRTPVYMWRHNARRWSEQLKKEEKKQVTSMKADANRKLREKDETAKKQKETDEKEKDEAEANDQKSVNGLDGSRDGTRQQVTSRPPPLKRVSTPALEEGRKGDTPVTVMSGGQ